MPDVTLFGFPRSVYVQMAGIVLTHKEVPYAFHDLETEMNAPSHLALHPFERVPILRHGDFTVYETAAIVAYVDDAFAGSKLTPDEPRQPFARASARQNTGPHLGLAELRLLGARVAQVACQRKLVTASSCPAPDAGNADDG